jgi:hypothetical protein
VEPRIYFGLASSARFAGISSDRQLLALDPSNNNIDRVNNVLVRLRPTMAHGICMISIMLQREVIVYCLEGPSCITSITQPGFRVQPLGFDDADLCPSAGGRSLGDTRREADDPKLHHYIT